MSHLHVDGTAGISGDMTLGALVDLGVPVETLRAELSRLPLSGWTLSASRVSSHGLRATRVRVDVHADADHAHGDGPHDHGDHLEPAHASVHGTRGWRDIERLLRDAPVPDRARARALATFRVLCEAEAALHGVALDEVHLHEVGAVDAVVDVLGACLGLEHLGVDTISCSPPELGSGSVRCLHGVLPVPAPATLKILEGRPVKTSGVEGELTTPTGAALLAALSGSWGSPPPMVVNRVGYGAGSRTLPDRPNVVRLTLGAVASGRTAGDATVELVADLDDADPQVLAAAAERLRERGALDVTISPVLMKKGRAGSRLTLLCRESERAGLLDVLFEETTTIGCRWHAVERAECERATTTVATRRGPIRMKIARWNGRVVNAKPEHDDCANAARAAGVPLKVVVAEAAAAFESGRLQEETQKS